MRMDFSCVAMIDALERLWRILNFIKKIAHLPGDIVEFGVFKGNSFFEFAHYRNILENQNSRKIVGFDMFGEFPQTNYEDDKQKRQTFINESGNGISLEDMQKIFYFTPKKVIMLNYGIKIYMKKLLF